MPSIEPRLQQAIFGTLIWNVCSQWFPLVRTHTLMEDSSIESMIAHAYRKEQSKH